MMHSCPTFLSSGAKHIRDVSLVGCLSLIAVSLSACSIKLIDVEELANGNQVINTSVSTLDGSTDEVARAKAEQEADKICQREGRAKITKSLSTNLNPITGRINAEIEFRCEPKIYQRSSR